MVLLLFALLLSRNNYSGTRLMPPAAGEEESDVGTRSCIPRMRGPTPPAKGFVPGPPDPVPSALLIIRIEAQKIRGAIVIMSRR